MYGGLCLSEHNRQASWRSRYFAGLRSGIAMVDEDNDIHELDAPATSLAIEDSTDAEPARPERRAKSDEPASRQDRVVKQLPKP